MCWNWRVSRSRVFVCVCVYIYIYIFTYLYILTYILIPWSRVLLEKPTAFKLVKKFPAFYGTRSFITAFTSARYLSLPWASSIQFIPPHPTSWRSILILSSHLHLGLHSCLFLSGFLTKTLYMPLLFSILVTCRAHLIRLDFITRTISDRLPSHYAASSTPLLPRPS